MPMVADPLLVLLPVDQQPADPTSYLEGWLVRHQMVALSDLPGESGTDLWITVPPGYVRWHVGADYSWTAVIDTAALARSHARVTDRGNVFEITPVPVAAEVSLPPRYYPVAPPYWPPATADLDVDLVAREQALVTELGGPGTSALMAEAARILSRELRHIPDTVTAQAWWAEPGLRVAESYLWFGFTQAQAQAQRLRPILSLTDEDPLTSVAPWSSANRTSEAQDRVLAERGRFARWTPADGDSLLASIIRGARDVADEYEEQADRHPGPHQPIAALQAQVREGDPQAQYEQFRRDLVTPGRRAHPLFRALPSMLPSMLRVRLVTVDDEGLVTVDDEGRVTRRSTDFPAVHLARSADHYMPALRRRPRPDVPEPATRPATAAPGAVDARPTMVRRHCRAVS